VYVSKGEFFLKDIPVECLERKYKQEESDKVRLRIKCAILRKKGKSIPTIAIILNKRESTISDILRRFEKLGEAACYPNKPKGRPQGLSCNELTRLKNILSKSPIEQGLPFFFWTTQLVSYLIKKKFNKGFSIKQVYRIMKSLGMSIYNSDGKHISIIKNINKRYIRNFDPDLKKILGQDKRSPYWVCNKENGSLSV
jgi:transposase